MGQETAERGPLRLRQPAPADRARRRARGPPGVRRRCAGAAPRCRSAPCCSTRGRSSSTTSATRAPSPTSTRRDFDRRFTLAAGLLELADREFSTIRDRLRPASRRASPGGRRRRPADRPARAGGVPRRAVRRGRLVAHRPLRAGSPGCCSSSGSPRSTSSARCCASVDGESINERMDYRYPPGAVRRLDDALLAVYGERLRRRCTATPTARTALRSRLEKLQSAED